MGGGGRRWLCVEGSEKSGERVVVTGVRYSGALGGLYKGRVSGREIS